MRTRNTLLVLLTASVLALASLASAAGDPPKSSEEKDKIVLSNGDMQVWFQGKKPVLRVLPANATDANATGAYTFRFLDVVEYRDLDNNGQVSQGEIVASLNLDRADGYQINRTVGDGVVTLNLALTDDVHLAASPLPKTPVGIPVDRQANVSLVFALRSDAKSVSLGPLNATLNASSIQYDFAVLKWPFVDAANDRLALEATVTGRVKDANATGLDSAGVSDANGTALGSLSWTTTAQGKTAASSIPVPVKTAVTADAEGGSRIVHTYDAPSLVALQHAGSIGLVGAPLTGAVALGGQESLKSVPAPGALLLVGGAGLVALAMRRR